MPLVGALVALLLPACTGLGSREPVLRIAVCQTRIDARPEVNRQRIEAAIVKAAALRADLACFPEACVFGWVNPNARKQVGDGTEFVRRLAREHAVMVVIGMAERVDEKLFNSVVMIDRDGRLLHRHRKVNVLEKLMSPPYASGKKARVIDTRLGRIGLLICADTFEKELVASLAEQAPDLVVVPYGWAAPAADWPDHGKSLHSWIAHTARTCHAPVVGVDSTGELHHGPWKGYVLGGQSMVCDAAGEELCRLPDRSPDVRIVEVDLRKAPPPTSRSAASQRQ